MLRIVKDKQYLSRDINFFFFKFQFSGVGVFRQVITVHTNRGYFSLWGRPLPPRGAGQTRIMKGDSLGFERFLRLRV